MYSYRLNLEAIEKSLLEVQKEFPEINKKLKSKRDTMSDEVVINMMSGYHFVDRMLDEKIDLLSFGNLDKLVEINNLVLCGPDPINRKHAHTHIDETIERFYTNPGGGIRDLMDWYEMHAGEKVYRRAAGVYVRILSEPQLFIEGNHRSGALIMSYLLVREGKPPFVLSVDNALPYFRPSTLIKSSKKFGIVSLWRIPKLIKEFGKFLDDEVEKKHFLKASDARKQEKDNLVA